jgi:hypothetical protein
MHLQPHTSTAILLVAIKLAWWQNKTESILQSIAEGAVSSIPVFGRNNPNAHETMSRNHG